MKYLGSKNRLSKELAPIIQSYIDNNNITKYYEPFCLGKNQIVYTQNGIKSIDEINIGDLIYDDNCQLTKVVNKVKSHITQGKKIKLKGNVEIIATNNHIFYLDNGQEIKTENLKIGDCLLLGNENSVNPVIDLGKYITISNVEHYGRSGYIIDDNSVRLYHNAPITNRIIPITKELMHCYGLIVAEGDKGNLTMNKSEIGYLEEFVKNYENILNIKDDNIKYHYKNNACQLSVPYKTIYEKLFFQAMNIGYGARNKNISFLFKCTPQMCLEAIRYMIIGDGCVTSKHNGKYRSLNYKTSSKTLAYQLQALFSVKLGIKSTLSHGVNKKRYIENRLLNETDYYNISITREDDIKLITEISNNNISIHEKSKGFIITEIEEIEDEFYDITLNNNTHRFIIDAGIVTHNCGGANMIDKIKCEYKFGSDNHKYLIALLKQAQKDTSVFPLHISEEEYIKVRDNKNNYPDWYVGLVGFCATFSGKWFNGYARGFKEDKVTPRDIPNESIRNIIKQAPNLKDIKFNCCDFRSIKNISGFVIYCFDKETEVLTKDGWKFFKDVDINNDVFLSREPNTKRLEYVKAINYISYKHNGKMYKYDSRQLDICVTDNHNIFGSRLVGRDKQREEFLMKATDFANLPNERTFIKSGGKWIGNELKNITIGEQSFDAILFARLLGIFLTDGSVNNQDCITISQSKIKNVDLIKELLDSLSIKYSVYPPKNNRNTYTFYLSKKYLPFFKQFYLKENRKIPVEFKNANIEVIKSLIEGILDGDSDNERRRIYIGSKSLVDDIQECLYKIGKASNYKIVNPKDSYLKAENRYIHSSKPYYIVSILNTEYPKQVKDNIRWVDYNDNVYCITLEKWHTVLTRRNGKTVWMGQCDPPYRDTTKYSTDDFPYEEFYDWCREMSKNNIVLVSEYSMPDDFQCVWSKQVKVSVDSNKKHNDNKNNRVEKLFIYKQTK